MKVIKSGKGWSKRLNCKGCEAVLEIGNEDIQYEVTDEDVRAQQNEVDVEGTYYVVCPECEQLCNLKAKDILQNVREYLRSR